MAILDRDINEKRDFIRMRIDSAVHVTTESGTYLGHCTDLSGSGMSISLPDDLALGTTLTVRIDSNSSNEELKPFAAQAVVRRKDPLDSGGYNYGLEIEQVLE